jgi:hypothetical protein
VAAGVELVIALRCVLRLVAWFMLGLVIGAGVLLRSHFRMAKGIGVGLGRCAFGFTPAFGRVVRAFGSGF